MGSFPETLIAWILGKIDFGHSWDFEDSTIRKLGLVHFRKDFWGCYWGQGEKIVQQLTGASQVTIPETIAEQNLRSSPLVAYKVAHSSLLYAISCFTVFGYGDV